MGETKTLTSGPPRGAPPAPTADAVAQADGLCCTTIRSVSLDEAEATELAVVFKALADPVRLRLVSIIAGDPAGEVCACDLPALVDRTQPTTSHHLSQLVRAGILERHQRGKWAWFRLRGERLDALGAMLASSNVHSPNIDSIGVE